MFSSADLRSFSQVSYYLKCAVTEAHYGNEFGAGRYIGQAEIAAAAIDDCKARDRANWLVSLVLTVAQDGHKHALRVHAA